MALLLLWGGAGAVNGWAWNPAPNGRVVAIVPRGNGQVLVAGHFTEIGGVFRPGLAMLNPDGTVDPQYSVTFTPETAAVTALTVSGNAVFLSGTFTRVNDVEQGRIARFTFLTEGGWILGSHSVSQWGEPLTQPARQIIHPERDGPVYFIGPDGGREVALESGVTLQDLPVPADYRKTILAFQGALYVGGMGGVAGRTGIQRLIGHVGAWEPDPDFNADGGGFNNWVQTLAADVGGEVFVAAGNFTQYNQQPAPHLTQLRPDGSLNHPPFPVDAPDGTVNTLVRDTPVPPGQAPDWFIGGTFSRIGDQARVGIARLTRSGYGVEAFNAHVEISFNGLPDVAALATTAEHLYVGGLFGASAKGAWRNNLLRLDKETGALDVTCPRPGPPGTALVADLHARPGDVVTLAVPENTGGSFSAPWPRGFPEPERAQIRWTKDGHPLTPSTEDRWSHTLTDARPEDSGLYAVELENALGRGTLTFRLQVTADPATAELTIYDPDGTQNPSPWQGGMLWPVVWGPPTGEALDIDLSFDGGATWTTVAEGITDYGHHLVRRGNPYPFGAYAIPVPERVTDQAKIRLRRSGSDAPAALSPGTFSIEPPTLPRIGEWRMAHFGTAENAGPAADDFDGDLDGLPNVVEYAFDTSPTDPNPPPVFAPRVVDGKLAITLPQIRRDIVLTVEQSGDLATWTETATSQSRPETPAWTVRVPADASAGFLRVNVHRPFP